MAVSGTYYGRAFSGRAVRSRQHSYDHHEELFIELDKPIFVAERNATDIIIRSCDVDEGKYGMSVTVNEKIEKPLAKVWNETRQEINVSPPFHAASWLLTLDESKQLYKELGVAIDQLENIKRMTR